MKCVMEVVTKMKCTIKVATEVEGANEMKSVMEVPTEWICDESETQKKSLLKIKMNWYICWEEAIEIISTMEERNEMKSTIKVATQIKL